MYHTKYTNNRQSWANPQADPHKSQQPSSSPQHSRTVPISLCRQGSWRRCQPWGSGGHNSSPVVCQCLPWNQIMVHVYALDSDKKQDKLKSCLSPIMRVLLGSIPGWLLRTSSNMAGCGFPITTGSRPAAVATADTMAPVPETRQRVWEKTWNTRWSGGLGPLGPRMGWLWFGCSISHALPLCQSCLALSH